MEIDIAKTTDVEIQEIMSQLIEKGFKQIDEGYIEIDSPISNKLNAGKKIGLVLYPELLSYYNGKDWITVPWICVKTTISHDAMFYDTNLAKEVGEWMIEKFKTIGYSPFKDEDAFGGHFKREETDDGFTELNMYINPSFKDGYWSNHTL